MVFLNLPRLVESKSLDKALQAILFGGDYVRRALRWKRSASTQGRCVTCEPIVGKQINGYLDIRLPTVSPSGVGIGDGFSGSRF